MPNLQYSSYKSANTPSYPSNTMAPGCIADVTGTSLPTLASAVYTPPTSSTDTIAIAGHFFTVTFNTNAATTAAAVVAAINADPTLSKLVTAAVSSGTVVVTQNKPGPGVGDSALGLPLYSAGLHGASWDSSFLDGDTRWFGQGAPLAGGAGPLQTGIGYGTRMTPVLARTSDGTVTSRQVGSGLDVQALLQFAALRFQATLTLATSVFTPPTSSTATCVINGVSLTSTFRTNAEDTCYDLITLIQETGSLQGLVTAYYHAGTVVIAGVPGQRNNLPSGVDAYGNGITTTSNAANGASFSASATAGGAEGNDYWGNGEDAAIGVVNDVGGSTDLYTQPVVYTPPTSSTDTLTIGGVAFTATFSSNATTTVTNLIALIVANASIAPYVTLIGGTTLTIVGKGPGLNFHVTSAGSNGASVESAEAALVAATTTYTPPTSSTDTLIINGEKFTVTFDTSATQTVTDLKAAIAASAVAKLVNVTGTSTAVITAANSGPGGNFVVFSTGSNGASLSAAGVLTSGATTGKGVRLVKSTGTVVNGGAVISGWLNEYAGGLAGDLSGGTITTGYVVVGRAS